MSIPPSTIGTKIYRIQTESQYNNIRSIISLSARVAQLGFCIATIYSGFATCSALASGSGFIHAGVSALWGGFKACIYYDLTRSFGNFAELFKNRFGGSEYSLREVTSVALQYLGMDNRSAYELTNTLDHVANLAGIYDDLGKGFATNLTKDTLILHHANNYIASIFNQRI